MANIFGAIGKGLKKVASKDPLARGLSKGFNKTPGLKSVGSMFAGNAPPGLARRAAGAAPQAGAGGGIFGKIGANLAKQRQMQPPMNPTMGGGMQAPAPDMGGGDMMPKLPTGDFSQFMPQPGDAQIQPMPMPGGRMGMGGPPIMGGQSQPMQPMGPAQPRRRPFGLGRPTGGGIGPSFM